MINDTLKTALVIILLAFNFYVYLNISQPSQDNIKNVVWNIPNRLQGVISTAVDNYWQDTTKNNINYVGLDK